jgi:Trp operon repressor
MLPEDSFIICYKWSRDWKKEYLENEIPLIAEYWLSLWNRVLETPNIERKLGCAITTIKYQIDLWLGAKRRLRTDSNAQMIMEAREKDLNSIADQEALENLLGQRIVQEVRQNLLNLLMEKADYIFVDFPDYNKTNLQLMSKDVDELQRVWNQFMEGNRKTSFLIVVQKEIVMKKPHYFFGKVRWLDLNPLTPDQLLEAYRQKWGMYEPFTEDALRLIGKLCRGVFRRFLNYINITIEEFRKTDSLISVDDVEKAVSFDVLLKDLELELSDIFPNAPQRTQAVKILDMLRKTSINQKQIAENLGIGEMTVARLVAKLELYNYIIRKRAEGKEWLITLK